MARTANGKFAKSQNGVSGNGGSGEGDGAASASGGQPGGGSGDGGGDSGDGIIRPTLNGGGDGDNGGDGGTGGDTRPKRGRPRGSTGQAKAAISVTTLAEVISFAHVGLAAVLVNDNWTLDDAECDRLAGAGVKVLRHYDTPAFSAQAMDWIGLLMVAGKIYSPRVMAAASRPSPKTPPAPARQEPVTPTAEQGDGFVTITDPLGSGKSFRVPAAN